MRGKTYRFSDVVRIFLMIFLTFLGSGYLVGFIYRLIKLWYWPGIWTSVGVVLFLSLGMMVGLSAPDVLTKKRLVIELKNIQQSFKPAEVAQNLFGVAVGGLVVLSGFILVGLWWINHNGKILYGGFVLTPFTLFLLELFVSFATVVLIGLMLGILVDAVYSVCVWRFCPECFSVQDKRLQNTVSFILLVIIVAFSWGWAIVDYLLQIKADQHFKLLVFPYICWFLALLGVLVHRGHREVEGADKLSLRGSQIEPKHIPVGPRLLVFLTIIYLGWSGLWFSSHIRFAILNWYQSDITLGDFIYGVPLIAAIGGVLGFLVGSKLGFYGKYFSVFDKYGVVLLALSVMEGIFVFITATLMKRFSLEVEVIRTGMLLLFMVVAFLWALALTTSISALAEGESDRFDMWMKVCSLILVGCGIGGILIGVWKFLLLGNLFALSLSPFVGILLGGLLIIYDEEGSAKSKKRDTLIGKLIYVGCIILGYVSFVIVGLSIYNARVDWLGKGGDGGNILPLEGIESVAFLNRGRTKSSIIWANQVLEERTEERLRRKIIAIINQIIALRSSLGKDSSRILLVGLPYITPQEITYPKICVLRQIDIDRSIRRQELRYKKIPISEANLSGYDEVYFENEPYEIIILNVNEELACDTRWVNTDCAIRKLALISADEDSLWIIRREVGTSEFNLFQEK